MSLIVIAGVHDCNEFLEVSYVANNCAQAISNFHISTIVKYADEYLVWLKELRHKYRWKHYSSPIIWRECVLPAGSLLYIGGAQEFYKYMCECYGLNYYLTSDVKGLIREQVDISQLTRSRDMAKVTRNVCVAGAGGFASKILISELLQLPELEYKDGITVTLYANTKKMFSKFKNFANDLRMLRHKQGFNSVKVDMDLSAVLPTCDLFIVLHTYKRYEFMSTNDWLRLNKLMMVDLAKQYDSYAPGHCRMVMVGSDDTPACFNATVVADNLQAHDPRTIVVVTQDLGLEIVPLLARKIKVPPGDVTVPPVWGFIGVNKFVDLLTPTSRFATFRPLHKITMTKIRHHKGQENCKTCAATAWNDEIYLELQEQKKSVKSALKMSITTAKIQATVELIRLWYAADWHGAVISAGIMSDGTFNIPKKMFFSQPASLCPTENCWRPHKWFENSKDNFCNHQGLVQTARFVLREHRVGVNLKGIWMIPDEVLEKIRQREKREINRQRGQMNEKSIMDLFHFPVSGLPDSFPFYDDIMDKVQEIVGEEIDERHNEQLSGFEDENVEIDEVEGEVVEEEELDSEWLDYD